MELSTVCSFGGYMEDMESREAIKANTTSGLLGIAWSFSMRLDYSAGKKNI